MHKSFVLGFLSIFFLLIFSFSTFLFSFHGYSCCHTICTIGVKEIEELEKKAKLLENSLQTDYGKQISGLSKLLLFASFADDSTKFKFQAIEYFIITKIAEFVKVIVETNGHKFFCLTDNTQDLVCFDVASFLTKTEVGFCYRNEPEGNKKNTKEGECGNGLQNLTNMKNPKENPVDTSFEHSELLKNLIESSNKRKDKDKHGFRYSNPIKYYSIYSYITSGKMSYKTTSKNLAVPSINSVARYVCKNGPTIVEGEFRVQQLVNFLESFNLPKVVWLSEDATGVEGRIEYDPTTNQIIGLNLPLDERTGLPLTYSYLAKSASEIQCHMMKENEEKSKLVYVILAQSVKENFPAFPLLVFGTSNKFMSIDVINRWEYTIEELKKNSIEVLGISSDADPRLLSAMRYQVKLGCRNDERNKPNGASESVSIYKSSIFNVEPTSILYIQDLEHIITKLRNRILDSSICMPMGNELVSVSHLHILLKNVPKQVHKLVKTDIKPEDRQNFRSMEKIMQPHVISALQEYVPDSEATIQYINLCRDLFYSFIDLSLTPRERVYLNWRAVFFFRIWRSWVSKNYNLKENFITSQTYTCIEINGHSLIQLILKLQKEQRAELFLPILFNSQPCEKIFRSIRSMTSIYWTRINGSMKDILHILKRIELLNEITYLKLPACGIEVPEIKRSSKMTQYELPDENELYIALQEAKEYAVKIAESFGMKISPSESLSCELNVTDKLKLRKKLPTIDNADKEEHCDTDPAFKNSPFVIITGEDGKEKTVRKSSLVWCLSNAPEKLSSDRLRRVQGSAVERHHRKEREKERVQISSQHAMVSEYIYKAQLIQIGDWCFFSKTDGSKRKGNTKLAERRCVGRRSGRHNALNDLIFGCVLAFKFVDGKKNHDSLQSHVLCSESNLNTKVLAKWYTYENGELKKIERVHQDFYINLTDYIATSKLLPTKSTENPNETKLLLAEEDVRSLIALMT